MAVLAGDSRASWFEGNGEGCSSVGARRHLWVVDGGGQWRSSWLSPVSCHVVKGEGEGGPVKYLYRVRSPWLSIVDHPFLVATSPTATWPLLLV